MTRPTQFQNREPEQVGSGDFGLANGGLLFVLVSLLIGLSKYRVFLIASAIILGLCSLLLLPSLPKDYTSDASITLRKSISISTAEDLGIGQKEVGGQANEDYREVQLGILNSDEVFRAVANRLLDDERIPESDGGLRARLRESLISLLSRGAEESYVDETILHERRLHDVAKFVHDGLDVVRGLKSPKVDLSFSHESPVLARDILVIYLEEYQNHLRSLYDIGPVLASMQGNLNESEQDWLKAQQELESFRRQNGIHDLDRQLSSVRTLLFDLENQIVMKRVEIEDARQRVNALDLAKEKIPATFDAAPSRIDNRYKWMLFNLLEVARGRLVNTPFIEGSPEFTALANPVEELERKVAAQPDFILEKNPNLPNINYFKLEGDLALARATALGGEQGLQVLVDKESEMALALRALESTQGRNEVLQRRADNAREIYAARREQFADLERIGQMGQADLLWAFKILQEPTLPFQASSPSNSVILLGMLVASCMIALVITLALSLLDHSFRAPIELHRHLGIAPLAVIPDLKNKREVKRLLSRTGRRFGLAGPARELTNSIGEQFAFDEVGPHAPLLISRIDGLLQSISDESRNSSEANIISVCGANSGSGTTTMALNIARRLAAREPGKVLLIIQRKLEEKISSPVPMAPLANLSEMDVFVHGGSLDKKSVREWLGSLGSTYAHVVLDAPPVMESEETPRMVVGSNIAVLVARADATRREVAIEAANALANTGIQRVGVVLNGVRQRLPEIITAA
jgi:uncharacterized protein involved in exopolysaccharide biosynthesis